MTKDTRVVFKTTGFEQACGHPESVTTEDILQINLNLLELKEFQKDFEGAKTVLERIKELLNAPDTMSFTIEEKYCRTLLATHRLLRSGVIRLRYESMDINGYFKLLQAVTKCLFNQNPDVRKARTVVAEEMSKLNLFPQLITENWQLRTSKAPNRAFMDILYKVRPEFAFDDLLRMEYSKLEQAWRNRDEKQLNEIRKAIKELGGTDYTQELKS